MHVILLESPPGAQHSGINLPSQTLYSPRSSFVPRITIIQHISSIKPNSCLMHSLYKQHTAGTEDRMCRTLAHAEIYQYIYSEFSEDKAKSFENSHFPLL